MTTKQSDKLTALIETVITHNELVHIAAKWLKHHKKNIAVPNCKLIAPEVGTANSTGETPDVLGWCYWTSILIEVKVSRSDFLQDKNKKFRINPDLGMGEFRYYCCPIGLIKETELPENWGLLVYENEKIEIIRKAERINSNLREERTMLLSLHRRESLTAYEQEQSQSDKSERGEETDEKAINEILSKYECEACSFIRKRRGNEFVLIVHSGQARAAMIEYSSLKDARIRELEAEFNSEEGLIKEAIIAARKIQDFLWVDYNYSLQPFNNENWVEVFQKRVDKISEITKSSYNWEVELRKRLLQQAALSVAAIKSLNFQVAPEPDAET
jgi:hypothetical protein